MLQSTAKPTKREVQKHVNWAFPRYALLAAVTYIIKYLRWVRGAIQPKPKPDKKLVKLARFTYQQPLPKYDNMLYENCMLQQVAPNTVVDFGGKPVTLDGGNWVNCKFGPNVTILSIVYSIYG